MEKKSNKNIYKILTIVFIIIVIILVAVFAMGKLKAKKAEQAMNGLAAETQETIPAEEDISEAEPEEDNENHDILAELGIEIPEKDLDWDAIKENNPDIYAWIYIPNTNVDYPILQSATDDTYYLTHNLDGSEGYPGCIYTEMANSKDFTDYNTVMYGHNMKDGSMFATLHDFEEEDFFNQSRYAYIYLPDGTAYAYDIFGAYEWSDEHILNTYTLEEDYQFAGYLTDVFEVRDMNKHFRDGVNVTSQNHIITMSTCIGSKPNNRYIVQGVLINDPQLSYEQQMELYNAGE